MTEVATACLIECQHDDMDAGLVERRFCAVLAAVKTVQGECRVLEQVIGMAEDSWRQSRGRLVELEILREALGRQLALAPPAFRAERSAA